MVLKNHYIPANKKNFNSHSLRVKAAVIKNGLFVVKRRRRRRRRLRVDPGAAPEIVGPRSPEEDLRGGLDDPVTVHTPRRSLGGVHEV